jgi:hypothetical protein
MNTLTQQQINLYQWQVADGVARIPNGPVFSVDWNNKETDLSGIEFQTNAPDGIYSGEAFEVIERKVLNEQIAAMDDVPPELMTEENLYDKTIFLRLSPSHLPAVLTTQPGEEWKDRYNEVWQYAVDWDKYKDVQRENLISVDTYEHFEQYAEKLGEHPRRVWHLIPPPAEQEAETAEQAAERFYPRDTYSRARNAFAIDKRDGFKSGVKWQLKQFQSTLTQIDQRISELEQMLDQCQKNELYFEQEKEQLNKRISELGNKWISVNDRLPEGQTEVLVYMPKYGSDMNVYFLTDLDPNRKTWFNCFFDTKPFSDVTHWMPLPTPPQH